MASCCEIMFLSGKALSIFCGCRGTPDRRIWSRFCVLKMLKSASSFIVTVCYNNITLFFLDTVHFIHSIYSHFVCLLHPRAPLLHQIIWTKLCHHTLIRVGRPDKSQSPTYLPSTTNHQTPNAKRQTPASPLSLSPPPHLK